MRLGEFISKGVGDGFPWMFDHCVHFFATAKYLMNELKIKEVYSLKSDISWMHDATKHALDRAQMSIDLLQRTGDIAASMTGWTKIRKLAKAT